jgi:hypothetical protein
MSYVHIYSLCDKQRRELNKTKWGLGEKANFKTFIKRNIKNGGKTHYDSWGIKGVLCSLKMAMKDFRHKYFFIYAP